MLQNGKTPASVVTGMPAPRTGDRSPRITYYLCHLGYPVICVSAVGSPGTLGTISRRRRQPAGNVPGGPAMTVEPRTTDPPWLATVLLAEDDTEESVMGSDWHMKAIVEAFNPLLTHAEEREAAHDVPWYVSSQITVIVPLPRRVRPWQPKPD